MAHKFDPKKKEKLHTPERLAALPPIETLSKLGLQTTDTFADVGCGTGYFTEAAVSILDRAENIYALDTSREMLDSLIERLGNPAATLLNTVQTGEYDFKIGNETVSYLFMSFVLHEVDDPSRFIREALRIIKKGGKIAVIEWEKKPTPTGPPVEHRLSKGGVESLLVGEGIIEIQESILGSDFYAFTGIKSKEIT